MILLKLSERNIIFYFAAILTIATEATKFRLVSLWLRGAFIWIHKLLIEIYFSIQVYIPQKT